MLPGCRPKPETKAQLVIRSDATIYDLRGRNLVDFQLYQMLLRT